MKRTKKKVIAVMGSPRRNGNTHILVLKILEGVKKEGANVDILMLKDLKILECDGCHICWGGKECSKKDDMNNIYPKIIESDIIIFGTPVYWYGPTALMKGFIDRLVYFNCPENRKKIKGKSVVIVVPFEEKNPDAVAPLVTFFEKCFQYLELNLVGKIIVPGVSRKGEVLEKKDILSRAYDFGKKLVKNQSKILEE